MMPYLRVARLSNCCNVLGPGKRAVFWLQGCLQRCPGCVAPETWNPDGGEIFTIDKLIDFLACISNIDGVTFSGGEPMLQAEGLLALIRKFPADKNLSTMLYTGYTLEHLIEEGTIAQRELLAELDILVDGPYVEHRHTDLYWRGSDNQRILFLSERFREAWSKRIDQVNETPLEFEIHHDSILWMGIPPKGFRAALEDELRHVGITITPLPESQS